MSDSIMSDDIMSDDPRHGSGGPHGTPVGTPLAEPTAAPPATPLLTVRDLHVDYFDREDPVHAVRGVDLTLHRGETLGIVGESGCGKSTLVTAVTRLERPPAVTTAGSVLFHGREHHGPDRHGRDGAPPVDLLRLTDRELGELRWERIAVVFQSAMNALNPVLRVGAQFADVLRKHRGLSRRAAQERAGELLGMVGIPADRLRSYAHELSGGMRQRATIALALACEPDLVVMDEPTTAVDVVMQRQILRQVARLKRELGFSVVFITHDLSLLIEIADRIAVMYAGKVVETGPARQLYTDPHHPYTAALRSAFPPLHGPRREITGIPGSPPGLRTPPAGCSFHPRCARRIEPCERTVPPLLALGGGEVACHLHPAPEPTRRDREEDARHART